MHVRHRTLTTTRHDAIRGDDWTRNLNRLTTLAEGDSEGVKLDAIDEAELREGVQCSHRPGSCISTYEHRWPQTDDLAQTTLAACVACSLPAFFSRLSRVGGLGPEAGQRAPDVQMNPPVDKGEWPPQAYVDCGTYRHCENPTRPRSSDSALRVPLSPGHSSTNNSIPSPKTTYLWHHRCEEREVRWQVCSPSII